MAQDNKYGQIDIPGISDDEPVFVIRGKDECAPYAIRAYADAAQGVGASAAFQEAVIIRAEEVMDWQYENQSVVKIPD